MSLSAYALHTLAEIKEELPQGGTGNDELLTELSNRATAGVEAYIGRYLVNRGGAFTEHHNPEGECELYLLDWPVISVTSVHESATRTYDADSLLTAVTDYGVNKKTGKLTRLVTSGGPISWLPGYRTVQVVYWSGYATRTAVPSDIRGVAMAIIKRKFRDDRTHGVASQSDATGSMTRFLPAELLTLEKEALDIYRRVEFAGGRSGERDSDVVST